MYHLSMSLKHALPDLWAFLNTRDPPWPGEDIHPRGRRQALFRLLDERQSSVLLRFLSLPHSLKEDAIIFIVAAAAAAVAATAAAAAASALCAAAAGAGRDREARRTPEFSFPKEEAWTLGLPVLPVPPFLSCARTGKECFRLSSILPRIAQLLIVPLKIARFCHIPEMLDQKRGGNL